MNDCSELLHKMAADIEGMREEIKSLRAAIQPRRRSRSDDRSILEKLLPNIKLGVTFTTKELLEDPDPNFKIWLGALNHHQVGNLLSRAVGVDVDGRTVQRSKTDCGAVVWTVEQVVK